MDAAESGQFPFGMAEEQQIRDEVAAAVGQAHKAVPDRRDGDGGIG